MQVLFKQPQFMPTLPPPFLTTLTLVERYIPNRWKTLTTTPLPSQITKKSDSPQPHQNSLLQQSLLDSLNAFITQSNLSHAFKTFSLLKLHASCTTPSSPSLIFDPFSSLLQLCTSLKSLPQGRQLHAQIIQLGVEQQRALIAKLVTFYISFSLLPDAHTLTEGSPLGYRLPWNLLISAYVKNGLGGQALSTFKQMVGMGNKPDNFTYPSVLKACGDELDLEFGKEVHKSIDASVLEWSLFVGNALVTMYAKCGEFDIARSLFDEMPERDAVSWNSMISGYTIKGMWKEATSLFDRMQSEGVEMNGILWSILAGGCLQTGNFVGALDLMLQTKHRGTHVDSYGVVVGLGACSGIGSINLGKEMHGYAIRNRYDEVESVRNALITMYSKCKDLRRSRIVFQTTEAKSVATWNSMIGGYAHVDRYDEVSFVLREMVNEGVEPDFVTIASVLPLCARVADLQHGKELHSYIMRRNTLKDHISLWNSLVDMYSKSGKVLEARKVFDSMGQKDQFTYTSLISGYGMLGEGRTALELFEEMIKCKLKPDHVTMVAVLSACSHSGFVIEGQMLFDKMINLYGIKPQVEHFACMIDLFGRAGMLGRAVEIIHTMPFQPTLATWATLLGACSAHGNTYIGEWAAEKLLEMKPQNSGYYTLIANMYAAAKSWGKLAYVRTLMRDIGVKKDPGCAWIDNGNGFHSFVVGDTSSPLAIEIYGLLYRLSRFMKEDDYVSSEDFR